ncbi:MAG TPA: hypothetical protein VFE51_03225 [Verrucomicrobiae bacterium]|nr:hypothetical protein [Verrucomicrobiae bacterium]
MGWHAWRCPRRDCKAATLALEIDPGALRLSQVQTLGNLFDREGRLLPQASRQRQLQVIALGTSRQVLGDGTFTVVVSGLNQPTSLQFIGNKANVVTPTGEIWRIDGLSDPPCGPGPRRQRIAD